MPAGPWSWDSRRGDGSLGGDPEPLPHPHTMATAWPFTLFSRTEAWEIGKAVGSCLHKAQGASGVTKLWLLTAGIQGPSHQTVPCQEGPMGKGLCWEIPLQTDRLEAAWQELGAKLRLSKKNY